MSIGAGFVSDELGDARHVAEAHDGDDGAAGARGEARLADVAREHKVALRPTRDREPTRRE